MNWQKQVHIRARFTACCGLCQCWHFYRGCNQTLWNDCTKAEDGLEAIRTHHPQVVFLDIEMPNMNGFQLLDTLEYIDFTNVFVTV